MAKKKQKASEPEPIDLEAAHLPKPTASPKSQLEKDMVQHVLIPIAAYDRFPMIGGASVVRNRYVLEHAHFYPPAERPKKYRKGKRKNCWGNAQLLAMDHPELNYVEGFAFGQSNALAFEHAWCVTENGMVVDTTWPEPGLVYYGVPFDREALMKHLEKTVAGKGETRPIMEPDFFDPDAVWLGGRCFGSRKSQG